MQMIDRFADLWTRIKAKGDHREKYQELRENYARPNRFYHTLYHISDCLDKFSLVRKLAENPDVIEFALWYHDAEKNEKESAKLARNVCRCAELPESFSQGICGLILATTHTEMPKATDAKIICDIDLSILGAPEKEFDNYEIEIRKEYSNVPNKDFAKGRVAILEKFLARPAIYSTSFFRQQYELQARTNMLKSITILRNSFKQ